MTDWGQHAACRGAETEKFFPMHRQEARPVIDGYCRVCPVVHECREDAESMPKASGVYGGDFWIDGERIPGHEIKGRKPTKNPATDPGRVLAALRAQALQDYAEHRAAYASDNACFVAIGRKLKVHKQTVANWVRAERDGARA